MLTTQKVLAVLRKAKMPLRTRTYYLRSGHALRVSGQMRWHPDCGDVQVSVSGWIAPDEEPGVLAGVVEVLKAAGLEAGIHGRSVAVWQQGQGPGTASAEELAR